MSVTFRFVMLFVLAEENPFIRRFHNRCAQQAVAYWVHFTQSNAYQIQISKKKTSVNQ